MESRGVWQPIETAPKDGSWFVTANFRNAVRDEYEVAQFRPQTWRTYEPTGDGLFRAVDKVVSEFDSSNFHRATHWMPLPEPPQ